MAFIIEQVLLGGIVPAVVMGIALLAARGISGGRVGAERPDASNPAGWPAALGFGLAFGAAYLATTGLPEFLPGNAMHWLFYMALVAAAVGAIESFVDEKEWLRQVLRVGLALLTFRLAFGFMVENYWHGASAWVWLGALTLAGTALINALDRAAQQHPGVVVPLVMVLLGAAGTTVLILTGNARMAQLMGGLIAAATATLVVAWRVPELKISRGGCTVFGLLFGALMGYGYFTSADIPAFGEAMSHSQTLATMLVVAAPMMLWVSAQNPIKRLSRGRAALACAALVAIPLGAAVYVAANPGEPEVTEYKLEGFDYGYE